MSLIYSTIVLYDIAWFISYSNLEAIDSSLYKFGSEGVNLMLNLSNTLSRG